MRASGESATSPDGESDQVQLSGGPPIALHDSGYPDWDSAYLDNVGRLYRLMYAKVGNRADAEDLTSEVFRAALGPLRLTASKGEVRAYLLATARTVLATHWRRRLGLQGPQIDAGTGLVYSEPPRAGQ